jgi:hypothetical protein
VSCPKVRQLGNDVSNPILINLSNDLAGQVVRSLRSELFSKVRRRPARFWCVSPWLRRAVEATRQTSPCLSIGDTQESTESDGFCEHSCKGK